MAAVRGPDAKGSPRPTRGSRQCFSRTIPGKVKTWGERTMMEDRIGRNRDVERTTEGPIRTPVSRRRSDDKMSW